MRRHNRILHNFLIVLLVATKWCCNPCILNIQSCSIVFSGVSYFMDFNAIIYSYSEEPEKANKAAFHLVPKRT